MKDRFAKATEQLRRRAWSARESFDRLGTRISVSGEGNQVDVRHARLQGVEIRVEGDDNVVRFHPSCKLVNASFRLSGNNLRVDLGERVKVSQWADFRLSGEGGTIEIAGNCTIESARFIARGGTAIRLGPECMVAYDVELRTTDSHSIVDQATAKRINPDRSVDVGRHVWLGARTTILKGVTIGDHSIVATGAVVSKDIGSGVVAGGVPARVLRTGVTWDRRRL